MEKLVSICSLNALELLDSLLQWDYKARLEVEQILEQEFFKNLRNVHEEPSSKAILTLVLRRKGKVFHN